MNNATSPLESLAAFTIAFVAGVVATAALNVYTSYLRRAAIHQIDDSDTD